MNEIEMYHRLEEELERTRKIRDDLYAKINLLVQRQRKLMSDLKIAGEQRVATAEQLGGEA